MTTFWQGRKVLLTGHTGFKGGWLSLWLQQLGADLVGVALPPPATSSLFKLADVAENMTSIYADIRTYQPLLDIFNSHQPEIVIHMAAQPLVRYSYDAPIETFATNVLGTVHVLEAARQSGCVKSIVNVTSDKCYENQEWHWGYRESDRLGGYDPYSNSKACAELVTKSYQSSYFNGSSIGLASVRAGNVIGGGDFATDRLVPNIMHACINNESVAIRHPNAIRPWQHVLDPLSGYLLLAEKLYHEPAQFTGGWNFGPEEQDAKPVQWITEYLLSQWSIDATWFVDAGEQVHEATYLKLDCAKSKALLAWRPTWRLEQGLQETVSWYQAFERGDNMKTHTLMQIACFVKKAGSQLISESEKMESI